MDAATRWETEAVRESRRPQVSQKQPPDRPWATLREAAVATGVPIGTVRSWAKTEEVASYLESDGETVLRMVDLDAVQRRAERLGRSADVVVDIRHVEVAEDRPRAEESDIAMRTEGPAAEEPESHDDPQTMIVPIDAWNKMLMQLGNLHEAGQQLAEARERAARAETETTFLREQLRDLRASTEVPMPEPEIESEPDPRVEPDHAEPVDGDDSHRISFIRYIYRGWRTRR